ncbi:hypothetical protein WJX81_003689 [Elliptochloris bilobata]|uniref:Small ribosomal subunit protein uS15c n=1 Tax=Elliptochloris bilobata TaxID=381761 RepID=A0AAW1RD48_9CHLO
MGLASCSGPSTAPANRAGFRGHTAPFACRPAARAAPRPAALAIQARFRGYNTDLSKVPQFKRSEVDTGSTEVQVAQLTARVQQLTAHLQTHRKDFACRRGLVILLGQRRRLMKYLYNVNRPKYDEVLKTLGVRPLKLQAARGVMVKLTAEDQPTVLVGENVEDAPAV